MRATMLGLILISNKDYSVYSYVAQKGITAITADLTTPQQRPGQTHESTRDCALSAEPKKHYYKTPNRLFYNTVEALSANADFFATCSLLHAPNQKKCTYCKKLLTALKPIELKFCKAGPTILPSRTPNRVAPILGKAL